MANIPRVKCTNVTGKWLTFHEFNLPMLLGNG